jgi:FtsZ-interacting cell division protein YlmF
MIEVGRRLKNGERVLLDLGGLPSSAKRRMLDACAGLVYGFDASATRTMTDRYLLEPSHATGDRARPSAPENASQ